jgi:hypothetical protein
MAKWIVAAAVIVVLALYLRGVAGRLDRLHVRVEAARDALDASLVRRTSAALDLAHAGLLDPATSVLLAEEVYGAQTATERERSRSESELTGALNAALPDEATVDLLNASARGQELLGGLAMACQRVVLARRFYNDAVRTTQVIRRRRLVRWLRLAGTAPFPESFEMDDHPPRTLNLASRVEPLT